jgi:hypothetical protein
VGPGNADCAQMDMTKTTAFETLFDWGLEIAITDSNSIKNTAVRPKYFRSHYGFFYQYRFNFFKSPCIG